MLPRSARANSHSPACSIGSCGLDAKTRIRPRRPASNRTKLRGLLLSVNKSRFPASVFPRNNPLPPARPKLPLSAPVPTRPRRTSLHPPFLPWTVLLVWAYLPLVPPFHLRPVPLPLSRLGNGRREVDIPVELVRSRTWPCRTCRPGCLAYPWTVRAIHPALALQACQPKKTERFTSWSTEKSSFPFKSRPPPKVSSINLVPGGTLESEAPLSKPRVKSSTWPPLCKTTPNWRTPLRPEKSEESPSASRKRLRSAASSRLRMVSSLRQHLLYPIKRCTNQEGLGSWAKGSGLFVVVLGSRVCEGGGSLTVPRSNVLM
jgi:hypothetical protein